MFFQMNHDGFSMTGMGDLGPDDELNHFETLFSVKEIF